MDWEYVIIENGSAVKLTRYTGNASTVVTPPELEGLPVRVLGNRAFTGNDKITSVVLSDSIETVEDGSGIRGTGAFRNCSQLCIVVLSSRMTRVADYMFYGAASQRTIALQIDFRNVSEIGSFAFACCNHIVHLCLPETVHKISTGAFYQARRLSDLDIPGVWDIAADAFTETMFEERYEQLWKAGEFSGVVYAGKVAYLYLPGKNDPESLTIREGIVGISEFLFHNHFARVGNWRGSLKTVVIPVSLRYVPEGLLDNLPQVALRRAT